MTPIAPADAVSRGKPWLWFALFVVIAALLGGSSRPDPLQNAVLRPIAALLLIPAFYHLRAADLAPARALLVLGGVMLVWMIVQLVPLPPSMWQALPGRDIVAGLDRLAGIDGIWRPISLAPFRGLNALLAMIVPVAALLLMLGARLQTQAILLAITAMGAVNAVFGILQVIGGLRSPFYLFALTNRGAPAGIFANENHAAVFAGIVLLIIARLAGGGRLGGLPNSARLALAPLYVLILLAVLISGSRAGLGAAALAVGAGGLMMWTDMRARESASPVTAPVPAPVTAPVTAGTSQGPQRRRRLALVAVGGVAACLVAAAFILLGRAPAAADLLASSATIDDLRWSLLPVLGAMMRDHWLAGTGFGAFDTVYRIYEPTALLLPLYVNQAHNDWVQLVIEGGLPAAACVLGLIGWLGVTILRIARDKRHSRAMVIFWITLLIIIMAASAVDYPLRTPIFQSVSVWLLLCLARDAKAGNVRNGADPNGEMGWQRARIH